MKKLFTTLLILLTFVSSSFVKNTFAEDDEESERIAFTEESIKQLEYETGVNSPAKGETFIYMVDENNNIVKVDQLELSARSTPDLKKVIIYLGTQILGTLTAIVINGVVTAVTGQNGEWWVAQAVTKLLNQNYKGSVFIDCNVYPMHSYEGAMCRKNA